jgi:hypothetical protein
MDDTTLRLRARVTILEQLIVRLFAISGAEHGSEVKAVVANLDDVIQNAKDSELFGADLSVQNRSDLFNMTTNEWAWIRAQILDPLQQLALRVIAPERIRPLAVVTPYPLPS